MQEKQPPAAPHVGPQVTIYAWSVAKRLRHIAADVQAYLEVVTNAMEGIFGQIKTLLPEDKWTDALDWHEICAGPAERGIFTFLKERMSFTSNVSLLNCSVWKKNKSLDSSEPVLHIITNAVPTNALQETIEAAIRTLPNFVQQSAISVVEKESCDLQ